MRLSRSDDTVVLNDRCRRKPELLTKARQPMTAHGRSGRALLWVTRILALALAGGVLAACGNGPGASHSPATSTSTTAVRATTSTTAASSARPPMGGFGIGVDVSPANLVPGLSDQPTGPALVSLLQNEGVHIVRLVADDAQRDIHQEMDSGGWKEVFDELSAAHIDAILLTGGVLGPNGQFSGYWPPEPLTPTFPAPGQAVESTQQFIANQNATLTAIKQQCGGLPSSLVAIEAVNEPLVTSATLPMLQADIAALHGEAPGLPITIAGWRTPAIHAGERWNFNDPADTALVAPLVDYVTAHMYLDNLPAPPGTRDERAVTDPSTLVPTAAGFLDTVISGAQGKPIFVGEFGGTDGTSPLHGRPGGSPQHQAAVIEASAQAMYSERSRGVTGGSVWVLEPAEGTGPNSSCSPTTLICFGQPQMTPALEAIGQANQLAG